MDTGVDHAAVGWEQARRLTFVPFLADGRCALVPAGDRLVLPSGEVLAGEDPMLDTGLRVPLVTAGFRRQGFHPFAVEGDHVYVWCEGDDGYRGLLRCGRSGDQDQAEECERLETGDHADFVMLLNLSTQSFGCRCGRPFASRKAGVTRASVNSSPFRMTRC